MNTDSRTLTHADAVCLVGLLAHGARERMTAEQITAYAAALGDILDALGRLAGDGPLLAVLEPEVRA